MNVKNKYPRNPLKRRQLPSTGGHYVRKNGKLEGAVAEPSVTKEPEDSGKFTNPSKK